MNQRVPDADPEPFRRRIRDTMSAGTAIGAAQRGGPLMSNDRGDARMPLFEVKLWKCHLRSANLGANWPRDGQPLNSAP